MSTEKQREIFEYQMNLAKEQGIKEKGLEPYTQYRSYTMKDKINPSIRKKISQAIRQTKETGVEHGFHLCIEKDGKLSPGDTCVGDECSIKLHEMHMPCADKKAQGDFHTHPYMADVRKHLNIMFKGSDELMKSAVRQFLEERGHTVTMPSHSDARNAILGKCAKKTEGTTCVGTDLDDNRIECWTPKNIDEGDCVKALVERLGQPVGEDDKSTLPHEWVRPLFNVEMIDLKGVKRKSSDKQK